jgi:hypothetical protein
MKNSKLVIGCYLILSLFAASCSKVIDVKETDFIGGDIALKTVANNEQGIIGAYAGMNVEMGILLNATLADEVKVAEFYNAATTHEWQYASTDIGLRDNFTAFPLYYRIIDRVNRVLQALPKTTAANATEAALKDKLKGEALFLRAFCHFELYRYYSNSAVGTDLALAYMETPSLDPQARITVAPFFAKLNADLAAAKPLLPAVTSDIYRANQNAATGLQARVALYTKDYANAVTYATAYINALPLATITNFPLIWTDANNSEVAFKLSRTPSIGGRIGSLWRGTSASASNIGTITWKPSDKIWDAYDKVNDVRFNAYFFDEPALTKVSRSSRLIKKYAGTAYATAGENVADAKVFRTGEMYLIRAEAKAETGDLAGAAADLNALRAARITGYVNAVFPTKDGLITAIMDERFKELPYEGHRFWDAKRRNLPITRLAADAPNAAAALLPAGNFRFLLPIPNSEIQANSLIQQNPGYTN